MCFAGCSCCDLEAVGRRAPCAAMLEVEMLL